MTLKNIIDYIFTEERNGGGFLDFETLQPLKLLREIKKEANGRKIIFTKIKWFYILFFFISGFRYKKGELVYI